MGGAVLRLPWLCAGLLYHEEANGARMSRLAGVTSLIGLTRGQARHRAEMS